MIELKEWGFEYFLQGGRWSQSWTLLIKSRGYVIFMKFLYCDGSEFISVPRKLSIDSIKSWCNEWELTIYAIFFHFITLKSYYFKFSYGWWELPFQKTYEKRRENIILRVWLRNSKIDDDKRTIHRVCVLLLNYLYAR